MQKTVNILLLTTFFLFLVSCGSKTDPGTTGSEITAKKAELDSLKKQQAAIDNQILQLQTDLAKLDPSFAQAANAKIVALDTLKPEDFTHYIDLQGRVNAENIAYVTPRNGGGQVKELYVKQGDMVHKGQLLLKLDDAIIKQQLAQAQSQLAYVKDIYQRRQNLWKENIGSQVDLITAKNNVDQVLKQIDLLNEQLNLTNVYAEMDGVADEVTIRVGEIFTGAPPMDIRLVNTSSLKVTVNVPENYLDRVQVGTEVLVTLPDINKTVSARVTVKGSVVDPNSGSFTVEAHLPVDKALHPNQTALVRIRDYESPKAIIVPVNTLQTDQSGKFVLVASSENNKLVARKRAVQVGQFYGDRLEITGGLKTGDIIITNGYEGLYDGQAILVSGH